MTQALAQPGMPRALIGASALTVSASALAALVYFGTHQAPAVLRMTPDPIVAPRAAPAVGAVVVAPTPPVAPPAAPALATPTPEATPEPEVVAPAAAIRVPDFAGKRLATAIREARALGLRVVARDSSGYRVPGYEARSYRVTRQTTEPGSNANEGDAVVVRVRSTESYGEGY